MKSGFTLIELSIVLVIIGLIVGGVLVGQDLIRAAEVRAQVSQVEKLNTAVNTFRNKFNALPGDIAAGTASQFGFTLGTGCDGSGIGKRDGNGVLENSGTTTSMPVYVYGIAGYESSLLWQDLSSSAGGNLIDISVAGASCASTTIASTGLSSAFPAAKLGKGLYIYVYSNLGLNWWGLSGFTSISAGSPVSPTTPMTVSQAYNIDKKMDDGKPMSGSVVANYVNASSIVVYAPNVATADTTHCFENTNGTYNVTQNNGSIAYCALSFRFQ